MRNGLFPGLALAALLLPGCGTDSAGPGDEGQQSAAAPVRFTGSIDDERTGEPIAGAVVEVVVGEQTFTERTDADGRFDFAIRVDAAALPEWTALVAWVDDDFFLPEAVFYAGLAPGAEPAPAVIRLATTGVADMVLQRSLVHLGDDNFSGAINSQLQAPTHGTSLAVEFDLLAEQLDQGGWLTVSMALRGAQCTGANGNQVYLGRVGEIPPDGDPRLLGLGQSADDGSFSTAAFTWDLSAYAPGDRLEFVVISSDGCNPGHWDDFELLEVIGRFHA